MSYTQLSAEERYVIYHLELVGLSRREIGRRLGRHHSTISREVARNGPTCGNVYWHRAAQEKALARRRIPRHWRRQRHGPLRDYVTRHLRQDWPPEAIAGRLRRDHPDDPAMRACSESIYRWV
jgi:IS30 family transposase